MNQVSWGLLDNAVEYRGGPPITVSVTLASGERRDAGGDTLRLLVADAGRGIADADRERLFERYAHGTLSGTKSTGLGRYVSRELARANDGDLVPDPKEPRPSHRLVGGPVGSANRGL